MTTRPIGIVTKKATPLLPTAAAPPVKKKPAQVPVYMNAPFRTEPEKTMRRAKSVSTTMLTSAAEKNNNIPPLVSILPKTNLKPELKEEASSTPARPSTRRKINMIDFKEIGPTLNLGSKFRNLAEENTKLSESIENELRHGRVGTNSFLQKFEANFTRKESILENNLNFYRMAVMYQNGSQFLMLRNIQDTSFANNSKSITYLFF